MPKVTVVALGKYPDIFNFYAKELDKFVPKDVRKIVVRDGTAAFNAPGWEIIQGPARFSMAGNYNIGWKAADKDSDILSMNDDIYFLEPNPIVKYQELVYSEPRIGCVCAYVKIGFFGNPLIVNPRQDRPLTFAKTATNGCTYFRRDMIEEVGYMDDSFIEAYGAEDADYTYRMNLAGWKVAIARDLPIKHGFDRTSSSTSVRALGRKMQQSNQAGILRFCRKHKVSDFRKAVLGEWPWPE
jgi:GT2 family glycosyltransferase